MIGFWRTSSLGSHFPHESYSKNCMSPKNGLSTLVNFFTSPALVLRVPMQSDSPRVKRH